MAFFLIIGLGSIGKRHLANLLHAGHDRIATVTPKPVTDPEFAVFPNYPDAATALDRHEVTHAFVCTPTAAHLDVLEVLLRRGILNIYLEKPVSHSLDGLDRILPLLPNCRRLVVGYDLHFDPGLQKVRACFIDGSLGRPLSLNAFVGQHLSQWRPHEDYRKGMSASVAKGGGVLLDLVHEFDYLRWLAGTPLSVSAVVQHNPEMEIETEDLADVLVRFERGISATLHLDYHQERLVRNCTVTFTEGTLFWNLAENHVRIEKQGGASAVFEYGDFGRNDRFRAILDAFLDEEDFDPRLTSFEEALVSLRMAEAAKEASENLQIISVA